MVWFEAAWRGPGLEMWDSFESFLDQNLKIWDFSYFASFWSKIRKKEKHETKQK